MSAITTHVLDTTRGVPAQGVPVRLESVDESSSGATAIAAATTDADGRVADLGPERLEAGRYRLVFDTAGYFSATDQRCFFPEVTLTFLVDAPGSTDRGQHFHVPLLLSPFTYTTYRGS